ncbi:MAG: nucleoside triphosphate pyrophosphohydrolase [Ruminococcaceae bacterium]|nr:nucleoside triphosphate pyrophosphohydrolase [Oscillospiraceae bacterium]
MQFKEKENYGFDDLVAIMELLRAPGGCPWDREQNHKTIRNNLIEETYEAIEAIDTDNMELLREELGDVLLQVVFHSRISEENGGFNINDVADEVCKKLIVRHPHVFGDVIAETSEKVLKNWDEIKKSRKNQTTQKQVMDSISLSLPALIRADKIGKKAAKVGFDFADAKGALEKVTEETAEVTRAIEHNDIQNIKEEIGDLLFSVVNLARKLGVDSEEALYGANAKFVNRFGKVETLAQERGIEMNAENMKKLDKIWEEIKTND